MQNMTRQILPELLWLTLSALVTVFLFYALFGFPFTKETIDIYYRDTMFVLTPWSIFLPLFFLLTFIIYFIKVSRKSFREVISNWIFMISGLTVIILCSFLIQNLSLFLPVGWTIYPPLSALGPDKVSEPEDLTGKSIIGFFTVIQILTILILLFGMYRWGRNRGRSISK